MDTAPFIRRLRQDACLPRPSGLTLLEVLAVIFIIGMTAALVFPSFGGFGAKGIRTEARRAASVLRYLNESAVSMKQTYPLRIDLGASSLQWTDPEGEKSERLGSLDSLDLQTKKGIRDGQVTVFFGPAGLQEALKLRLRDEDRSMTVAFNPVSGRVKIIEDGR